MIQQPPIKALTVCVGYDDFLRLSLPRILPHVSQFLVITSSADKRTQDLVTEFSDKVKVYVTDVFYEQGASFNKGAAIEQGFDALGRDGWFLVMDADIVVPARLPQLSLRPGYLYSSARRILSDVAGLTDVSTIDQESLPLRKECSHYGYFQLFHSSDPLMRRRPWYDVDWMHAGGCDATFRKRWPKHKRIKLPFEVVHLGDPDRNWFGRVVPRIDNQEQDAEADERAAKLTALHRKYGWCGQAKTGEAVTERLAGSNPEVSEPCHDNSEENKKSPRLRIIPQTPQHARRRRPSP